MEKTSVIPLICVEKFRSISFFFKIDNFFVDRGAVRLFRKFNDPIRPEKASSQFQKYA